MIDMQEYNKVKLSANILFAGIGCQERGIINTNLFDLDVICTSEINKTSILSYASIHNNLTDDLVKNYTNYPTRQQMINELIALNIGYIPEEDKIYNWNKYLNNDNIELNKYWLACKLNKNKGDISKIERLDYADLWTISFPCTDISCCGKMQGLEEDSGTRSSLLWQNIRLLKVAKEHNELPKYLLFENVKNLISNRFINDLKKLFKILSDIGFNSYYKVINAKDCGIPQNRERVFIICIRKDLDNKKFTFPKPFNSGLCIKDIFDEVVSDNYYLSTKTISKFITLLDRKQEYLDNKRKELNNHKLFNINKKNIENTSKYTNFTIRKLTPFECFKLMGLNAKDCQNAIDIGVSYTQLYSQAGNGIVTNCIQLLFEHLYKALYDNTYQCSDDLILTTINNLYITKSHNTYFNEELYNVDSTSSSKFHIRNFSIIPYNCNKTMNIKLLGGIGKCNFGDRWRMGNCVYGIDGIAPCLMAQPLGNTGGYTTLWLISDS